MVNLFDPVSLIPPHRITRPEQVDELQESMLHVGWRGQPLFGYPFEGGIQLLTGTHRRMAAIRAGLHVPVKVHSLSQVQDIWGTDNWSTLFEED